MKYEIVMHYAKCDNEFHYELRVNDYSICYFCSFEIIKRKLAKEWWNIQKLSN